MNDKPIDRPEILEAPADKAARAGFWLAVASFASLGLSVWLAELVGVIACNVGPFVWFLLWTTGVGLAYAALRNAWGSATPDRVKRWSWGALAVSAVNLTLSLIFVSAINSLAGR